jgi:hypothetical protein
MFRVVPDGAQPAQGFFVLFALSDTASVNVASTMGVADHHAAPEIDRALLRYGLRWIEQAARDGSLVRPGKGHEKTLTVSVTTEHLDQLQALAGDKDCSYQIVDGRDLYCAAATPEDETQVGSVGIRIIAPTSRPLCAGCAMPDADFVCSNLHHPRVYGIRVQGATGRRTLSGAICDAGRQEIDNPGGCHAAGHDCWERVVGEPVAAPVEPVSLSALPQAFDHLDAAWRLAFENRHLLERTALASAAGLAAPCTNLEEFRNRLSDLSAVLKTLRVADELIPAGTKTPGDHSLQRIDDSLSARLEEDSRVALRDALGRLRLITRVRAAGQHPSGVAAELPGVYAALGISYPPQDFNEAWGTIRAHAVSSLEAISKLVLALDADSPSAT